MSIMGTFKSSNDVKTRIATTALALTDRSQQVADRQCVKVI
jgi:hypothetical protein